MGKIKPEPLLPCLVYSFNFTKQFNQKHDLCQSRETQGREVHNQIGEWTQTLLVTRQQDRDELQMEGQVDSNDLEQQVLTRGYLDGLLEEAGRSSTRHRKISRTLTGKDWKKGVSLTKEPELKKAER